MRNGTERCEISRRTSRSFVVLRLVSGMPGQPTKSIELDNLETQDIFLSLWIICRYKNKNQLPGDMLEGRKGLKLGRVMVE